jgi:hypothetical protein
MISYVMRPAEVIAPSVVPAGSTAEIGAAELWAPLTAFVTRPSKQQTPLQFDRSDGRLAAAFSATDDKGYYSIKITGGPPDQPRQAEIAFAVNLSPDESNFEMITEENLRNWLPGVEAAIVDASAETEFEAGQIGEEREIWRPLIALMIVIIGIEFFLSTLSSGRDSDVPTVAQRIRRLNPGRWVEQMTGGAESGGQNSMEA